MTNAEKDYTALIAKLEEEKKALEKELRRTKRELNSVTFQIDRYRMSVTAKDKMSQMISAEKERRELYLNNLLRVMPEIVLFMNADLEVVMCSESYLAAAGMTSYDEIIGTPGIPMDRLEYPDGQAPTQVRDELFHTMWNKELLEEEIYFTFVKDSPKKYYKKYTLPICNADDEPVGVILLFIDLSDIIETKRKAEMASMAKSNFLANMSHEMRTPMNAIIGMTSIAENTDDIKRKDYSLSKIHSASTHLLGVINDILDMSKIEANKMDISPEVFDFERMLMRVAGVIGFNVDKKEQTLDVQIDEAIPKYLVSDDQRLSQVITNLLSNAVKFTPEGGTITLKADLVSEVDDMCTVRIEVSDSGIGISDEQQSRLFRSFEQADASTSRKYGGTGLGLSISKKIVEMLGGSIHVESELGQGSHFIFTIVAKREQVEEEAPTIAMDQLRVLVVDASQDVGAYFGKLAGKYGFACDAITAPKEAEAKIAATQIPYDIAFVDMKMPGLDGLAFIRDMKARNLLKTAVAVISSVGWEKIEQQALAAGVDQFISKPLFPSAILDMIQLCCDPDASNQQAAKTHDFTGKHLLLAEDIEINREILITVLEPTGIEIDSAENGKLAVEMFAKNPERYDVIFMDIHMPEKDGYEATREIRALPIPYAKEIPIVAMTANVFREDIEACLRAGMNGHLGKPLDFKEVEKKLAQYTASRS